MKPNSKNELSYPGGPPAIFNPITPGERRRLDASLLAEIRRLERCRKRIAWIDQEVFQAGISCLGSATVFGLWLSEPAGGLGGKVPFQVMRTAKGRKNAVNLLRRIEYGVY